MPSAHHPPRVTCLSLSLPLLLLLSLQLPRARGSEVAATATVPELVAASNQAALDGDVAGALLAARHALRIDPTSAEAQLAAGIAHWAAAADLPPPPQRSPAQEAAAARHYTLATTGFKRALSYSPWDATAAEGLRGMLGHVAKAESDTVGTRVIRTLHLKHYISGPTRHARRRTHLLHPSVTAAEEGGGCLMRKAPPTPK